MSTPTTVQLFACLLQMQTPGRGGRCRGEDYIKAGDTYLQERQNNPAAYMYALEQEASPASHYHQKDENFSGGRR